MEQKINIVIADDHPIVRQGFIRVIEMDPSFKIVAQAGDGEEAVALIREHQPHVAVLDVSMPGKTGLEIVKTLREEQPDMQFVILTMYKDREYFDEAMEQGVKGYVLKENAVNDLLECLKAVHQGRHYISPTLSGYLLDNGGDSGRKKDKSQLDELTASEKRVLRLIGENQTSKEIADALFISYRTVQNHRFNICQKLGLKGHNKLLQFAIEHKAEI